VQLSIIIPTCNNPLYLEKCIHSIAQQEGSCCYEIVVVDYKYDERIVNIINAIIKKYPNLIIKYVIQDGKGLNDARNKGIKESTGEILLFLDDDVILPNFFLKKVYEYFDKNKDVSIVGFKDLPLVDDSYFAKCGRYIENISRRYFLKDFEKIKGAAMAIRRSHLSEYFDPARIYRDKDETELVYRMKKTGKKISYVSHVYLYHRSYPLKEKLSPSSLKTPLKGLEEGWAFPTNLVVQFVFSIFFLISLLLFDNARFEILITLVFIGLLISLFVSLKESKSIKYCLGIFLLLVISLIRSSLIIIIYWCRSLKSKIKISRT